MWIELIESLKEQHELLHFSHFMEAALGIGIAFTIFEDIHNWGYKTCTQRRDDALKKFVVTEPGSDVIKAKVENTLKASDEVFTEKLASKVRVFKVSSFIIGLIFYALLAFIGLLSDTKISTYWFLLLILIGILPLIFMMYIYKKWSDHFIESEKEAQFAEKLLSPPKI